MLLTRHPWLGTAWQAKESAAGTGGARSVAARQCRRKPEPRKRHIQGILASRLNTVEKMALPPKKTTKNLQLTAAKSTNILKAWIIYGLT